MRQPASATKRVPFSHSGVAAAMIGLAPAVNSPMPTILSMSPPKSGNTFARRARKMRRLRVGFHVQKVQPDAVDQLAFAMQREQRVVGTVFVEMRGRVGVRAGGRKPALVEMRRYP